MAQCTCSKSDECRCFDNETVWLYNNIKAGLFCQLLRADILIIIKLHQVHCFNYVVVHSYI